MKWLKGTMSVPRWWVCLAHVAFLSLSIQGCIRLIGLLP